MQTFTSFSVLGKLRHSETTKTAELKQCVDWVEQGQSEKTTCPEKEVRALGEFQ